MVWNIEFDKDARKELAKLDGKVSKRILKFIFERLAQRDNPRELGEALTGARLGEFWKYRVGDYRVIAKIEDQTVSILVVRIGNRRDVYR
jgi:mRNA interferase RelE/StbE